MTRQVQDRVSRLMAGGVRVAVGILGEVRESFLEEGVYKLHQRREVPLARKEREKQFPEESPSSAKARSRERGDGLREAGGVASSFRPGGLGSCEEGLGFHQEDWEESASRAWRGTGRGGGVVNQSWARGPTRRLSGEQKGALGQRKGSPFQRPQAFGEVIRNTEA